MNKQIPFYDVIMKAPMDKQLQPLALPDGYTYKNYEDNDEEKWAELECEVGEFANKEEALAYFHRVFSPHKEQLKKRMFFILDANKNYVATASAWFKDDEKRHYALVHWVCVSSSQQGKGLGRKIVHYVLANFPIVEPQEEEIFLHTQTWSYKAIALYGSYGFRITYTPLLQARTQEESIPVLQSVLGEEVVNDLLETI